MIQMNTHTTKNQRITDAIQVSMDIYESIDALGFKGELRIKFRALGQCLRSIRDELPIESDK